MTLSVLFLDVHQTVVDHIFMSKLKVIFISGLISFLPIALTIYIVYAGISIVENLLGQFLRKILPPEAYYPGYGFLATIILIFVLGLLLNNLVTAALIQKIQEKLTEIPMIKVVYSPLRDLVNLFSKGKKNQALKKVVLVQINEQMSAIGLVTREDFSDLNLNLNISEDRVAVYIPMSYGLGGYTLLTQKKMITPLDIPVEKAMSLAITGWIKTDQNTEPKNN